MGYLLVAENDEFKLYVNKGDEIIIPKHGAAFVYVDDDNDARILKRYRAYPAPPWN